MKKALYIFLICIISLSCNVNQELTKGPLAKEYAGSTEKVEMCLLDTYECQSKQLSHMLDIFKDSCLNRYGCNGLEWVVVNFMYEGPDCTSDFVKLSPKYYSSNWSFGLTRFKANEFVVIRIDSVNILLQKEDLYSSNYFVDIKFIGEQEKYLKYNKFQECMKKYGMLLSIIYNYSPGIDSVSVKTYGEYIPPKVDE